MKTEVSRMFWLSVTVTLLLLTLEWAIYGSTIRILFAITSFFLIVSYLIALSYEKDRQRVARILTGWDVAVYLLFLILFYIYLSLVGMSACATRATENTAVTAYSPPVYTYFLGSLMNPLLVVPLFVIILLGRDRTVRKYFYANILILILMLVSMPLIVIFYSA
ncbi:MAG: hypothetical protein GXO25_05855 [Euryarchaeota archaeon]|nr:hypothetical protein [Euryarchaeota archaeon]